MTLTAKWEDAGREPTCPANQRYPKGIDVDVSMGASKTCQIALPYPAPRCGLWVIGCETCGMVVNITAAGRADDPRSVRIACLGN